MEVAGAKRNKTIVFIYEAVGTGLLLYAINIQKGATFGQFGIAFMIFAMILIGGPITGGHFNPAVTLAVYISNVKWREDWQIFLLMLSAQFFGALWGVCLAWNSLYNPNAILIAPNKLTRGMVPESEIVLLYPADQVSNFDAF
jgi:glycerol uptake facilitator-like aquaporin